MQLPRHTPGIQRTIINTAIALAALLVLAVGGLTGYAWYSGRNAAPVSTADTAVPSGRVVREAKAPVVDPKTPVGLVVQSLTSPVTPGSNVSLNITTKPLSDCVIEVWYDKTKSTDSGLGAKKADEFGLVGWTWTVETSRPLGTWPVNVTCKNGERSGFVRADLVLVKTLPE